MCFYVNSLRFGLFVWSGESLVECGADVNLGRAEIKGLDGERKALVYDNYSKLITATDTIRKVLSPTLYHKPPSPTVPIRHHN